MSRENRIYNFLIANPGWQARDDIMFCAEFPNPKRYPVIAYVEFQNEVMRLNARLATIGKEIVRGAPSGYESRAFPEFYQIVSVARVAA